MKRVRISRPLRQPVQERAAVRFVRWSESRLHLGALDRRPENAAGPRLPRGGKGVLARLTPKTLGPDPRAGALQIDTEALARKNYSALQM